MNNDLNISKTSQRTYSFPSDKEKHSLLGLILLIILNMFIGLLLYKIRILATLHALLLPLLAILALSFKKPFISISFLSYIVTSHVLWRMTKAHVFWEYSKYVSILLAILIILRYVRHIKNFILPGLFILLLSISIPLTINYYGSWEDIRRELAFNLSGPFLLSFSLMLFYNIKISKTQMRWVLLSTSMPTISIGAISLYSLLTNPIIYTATSNFTASGGFGPNQVSATMSLGALFFLILAINYYKTPSEKVLVYTLSLWLFIQSLLTFSRGGFFNFSLAVLGLLWFTIKDKKTRARVLGSVFVISIFILLLLPKLQYLTQGKLTERFTNLNPTGREEIVLAELKLFEKHPIFGVGPGVGIAERSEILGYYTNPHTEYTRLLAEHGIFGLIALIILFTMMYIPIKNVHSIDKKGENAAFVLWSIVEMAHSATRIAITGYLPGIAYLNMHREE